MVFHGHLCGGKVAFPPALKCYFFSSFIALHTYASNAVLPAGFLHTYVVCEWKFANID